MNLKVLGGVDDSMKEGGLSLLCVDLERVIVEGLVRSSILFRRGGGERDLEFLSDLP